MDKRGAISSCSRQIGCKRHTDLTSHSHEQEGRRILPVHYATLSVQSFVRHLSPAFESTQIQSNPIQYESKKSQQRLRNLSPKLNTQSKDVLCLGTDERTGPAGSIPWDLGELPKSWVLSLRSSKNNQVGVVADVFGYSRAKTLHGSRLGDAFEQVFPQWPG